MIAALVFLAICAGLGFLTACTARFLDNLMDYGHIFGHVRYNRAIRHASGRADLIQALKAVQVIQDFRARLNEADDVYWHVAAHSKWFTPWVCVVCMATRIAMLSAAAGSCLFALWMGSAWYVMLYPVAFVLTAVFAHFVIDRK